MTSVCRIARIALLVLVASGPASLGRAQSPETLRLFDDGNRHYDNGEYGDAVKAYLRADSTGFRSAALYYNLGNAYYRLDEIGLAVLSYERALELDPDSRVARHGLRIVRARMMDQMSRLPTPIWVSTWRRVEAAVGLRGVVLAGLVLYLAACALVLYRILIGRHRVGVRRAAVVMFAVAIPLVIGGLTTSRYASTHPRCVVLDRTVSVRVAPSRDAESDVDIHEGLVVTTLESDSAWYRVRLPNGVTGWVEASALEKI